jgi:hypothetical protein
MASDRKLRKFLHQWRQRYPIPEAWVDDRANKQCRRSEARWLAQFEGSTSLKRWHVRALIARRFWADPDRQAKALWGIESPNSWGRARRSIHKALEEHSPTAALEHLVGDDRGVPGWDTATASMILAACRPKAYVVADARALAALRGLGLCTPSDSEQFQPVDWWPYLRACRRLSAVSGLSLGAVGQALWAAGDKAPNLPERPRTRPDGRRR